MNRTERAKRVLSALRNVIARPETELSHKNPYELIVAVILSAQCTDARVNMVTPALFETFPNVRNLAKAEPEEVFPWIRSISFPNNKAKHLVAMARRVMEAYDGRIPNTVQDLMTLQGVGRKTAQVVASVAFDRAALPVDTHVFRVANRIGLVEHADTPLKVEQGLKQIIPETAWGEAHHLLILHGRYTCTARAPSCDACAASEACRYGAETRRLPEPLDGLDPARGKYYCKTRRQYFDAPDRHTDRHGTEQICCPLCGSMNVFYSKTGATTRKVRDYRV